MLIKLLTKYFFGASNSNTRHNRIYKHINEIKREGPKYKNEQQKEGAPLNLPL